MSKADLRLIAIEWRGCAVCGPPGSHLEQWFDHRAQAPRNLEAGTAGFR